MADTRLRDWLGLRPNLPRRLASLTERAPRRGQAERRPEHAGLTIGPGALRAVGVSEATRRYLLYAVLPLWLSAAFADYLFHRRSHIAETSGTRESAIHLMMMAETGTPLLMGLFLESNSLTLLLMSLLFVAHEATAYWDVNYAETRRTVIPNEQHAHSFLEVIPFMALSMMLCLNWEQALALVGKGPERPRFTLRPQRPPASRGYVTGILAAIALFGALPYAEEFIRCWRADPSLAPTPSATDAPVGNLRASAATPER